MTRFDRFVGLDVRPPARDDRVLPITRWLARLLVPALAVAFLILYGAPGRTADLFAWTIRPDMTPLLMGAGYGTGAYFFYRVATVDDWHEVAAVFPGIAIFTWFMGLATALHWGNFNHDHVTFGIWTVLYAVAPVLVPAIWAFNRRMDPHDPDGTEARLPAPVRWASGLGGLAVTLMAALLFVRPAGLIAYWPWALSPLTARILLGWFALFGVVNLAIAFDVRWSTARIPVQTQLLGFGLVLVGAARAWGDFDPTNPVTWGFLGGFGLYLLALLAVYVAMETR